MVERRGTFFAAFFIFAAFVLLLLTTLSAPIINRISFLNVYSAENAGARARLTFGSLGYCLLNSGDSDACSRRHFGYDVAGAISAVTPSAEYSSASLQRLTRALILQPIATGLTFIAFLAAFAPSRFSKFIAPGLVFLATIVALVVWAIELGIFVAARNHVNHLDIADVYAKLGAGIWMNLAAVAVLVISFFVACFECCCSLCGRREI